MNAIDGDTFVLLLEKKPSLIEKLLNKVRSEIPFVKYGNVRLD